MAHPFASQAQASQRRRLSALGGKAGKSFGSSSMYKKHSYPSLRAGTERPMTISGGGKAKKYADGGGVMGDTAPRNAGRSANFRGGASGGGARKRKGGKGATTNIIIADRGGGGGARPVPVPVARPVPVPVGAAPVARRPVVAAPAAAPPVAAPVGPPPGMPPGGPPVGGVPRLPGMADGGGLPGYKDGGPVKKANGGGLGAFGEKDESPDGYRGYPHSPTTDVDDAVSAKKDGGAIKKAAFGGFGRNAMVRGRRPGGFRPAPAPGTPPAGRGPVVPLTGGGAQRPTAGLGLKKGGKAKEYKKGGAVHDDEAQDRKLFKKMIAKEEKAEKKADGGIVKTPITNATGGGAGGKARKAKTSAAKSVPAVTEDKSSASAAGHNPAPRGMAGSTYHQQGKGVA